MSITVLSTPIRTVNGVLSNVAAGLTQLPYKFERRDFVVTSAIDTGGQVTLQLSPDSGDVTSLFLAGENVYLNTENLVGTFAIFSSSYSDPITSVVIEQPYTADIGGGFVNMLANRKDYRILLNFADPITGGNILPVPLSYVPKSDGSLFVNVANFASPILNTENTKNQILRYSEYYDGISHSTTNTDPVFVLSAKRQFQDEGGSNMWRYLPNPETDPEAGIAKRLTEFVDNFVYIGWRSWLSTIFDSNINVRLGDLDVGFDVRAMDINNNILSSQEFLQLPQDIPNIYSVDIPENLKTVANAYSINAYLKSTSDALTSEYSLIIKNPCRNAIMIEWVGRNGINEQYLFSINQEVTTQADEGVAYETPIEDTIDNVNSNIGRSVQGSFQYMVLLAENIPVQHVKVLKYMKESPRVALWLNNDGSRYIDVIVSQSFSTPISTKEIRGSFSVQVQFPRNYDYFKALD